jgi:hypothetical protein
MIHELAIALIVRNSTPACHVARAHVTTARYCAPVQRATVGPRWIRRGPASLPTTHPLDVMVGRRCYIIG